MTSQCKLICLYRALITNNIASVHLHYCLLQVKGFLCRFLLLNYYAALFWAWRLIWTLINFKCGCSNFKRARNTMAAPREWNVEEKCSQFTDTSPLGQRPVAIWFTVIYCRERFKSYPALTHGSWWRWEMMLVTLSCHLNSTWVHNAWQRQEWDRNCLTPSWTSKCKNNLQLHTLNISVSGIHRWTHLYHTSHINISPTARECTLIAFFFRW